MRRLTFLPLLLLPSLAMAQGAAVPPQAQESPKERATEGMLLDAMRGYQQAATERETYKDALLARTKELADKDSQVRQRDDKITEKDAQLKQKDDKIQDLEKANAKMTARLKATETK